MHPATSNGRPARQMFIEGVKLYYPEKTQDELEIYLSSDTDAVSDIWTSTRTASNSEWKPAVKQADLSSSGNDVDPDVSPDGLVMTNHHVAAHDLDKVSTPEKNYLRDGFWAKARDIELDAGCF